MLPIKFAILHTRRKYVIFFIFILPCVILFSVQTNTFHLISESGFNSWTGNNRESNSYSSPYKTSWNRCPMCTTTLNLPPECVYLPLYCVPGYLTSGSM